MRSYLRRASCKVELLAWRRSLEVSHGSEPIVADRLFHTWTAFIAPEDPSIGEAFDQSEIGAIEDFDAVIHEFHTNDASRLLPLDEFVKTTSFENISTVAKACLNALSIE